MNFLGVVLFPFTILYDLATRIRNYLYNIGYKTSFEFETCVIAVGNLSVGGTGKTPMVEYLIRLLKKDYELTTLSRGYGRKTKGFRLAGSEDTYRTLGDEPMQFFTKYQEINVAVGEERAVAIPFILAERSETKVILLDDAYQHRAVKPNCNILLTDYSKPFYNDFVLPSGRLREARKGARRADAVVITKCPNDLSTEVMNDCRASVSLYSDAPVYFTSVKYLKPKPVYGQGGFSDNVFLFSGIANAANLKEYVENSFTLIGEKSFGDHHDYSLADIELLLENFNRCSSEEKCLLTTEKDMVKLWTAELKEKLAGYPIFYLPIETYFLKSGNEFDSMILKTVKSNLH